MGHRKEEVQTMQKHKKHIHSLSKYISFTWWRWGTKSGSRVASCL